VAKALAYIAGAGGVGPFGNSMSEFKNSLSSGTCQLNSVTVRDNLMRAGTLSKSCEDLLHSSPLSNKCDKSVKMALLALRDCLISDKPDTGRRIGISMGTSRGLTRTWESSYDAFSNGRPISPFVSPVTTPGNLTSELAREFNFNGPELTVSMTCSSGMAAIINGLAWLTSGWVDDFIAGGSEAALTPFTLAQAQALNLYSNLLNDDWPCRPLDTEKAQNTKAMQQALSFSPGPIEAILVHAPGTQKGDEAELRAINRIFPSGERPVLYPLKALIGHTYGASGPIACLAALTLMDQALPMPAYLGGSIKVPKAQRILVNSAGFGGQSISLLLESPSND
jgi:3-oxoacyl-(acyl-carrier-protein) synthase